MSAGLTTHVLDTAQGCPAAGVEIELWSVHPNEQPRLLRHVHTNAEGRTDKPLLAAEELRAGTYEMVFTIGAYFARQRVLTSSPPFLDRVPIRFTIAVANTHYHVPLLVSPWSYSTYRGS